MTTAPAEPVRKRARVSAASGSGTTSTSRPCAAQAAIKSLAQPLTGEVAVRAYKGSATTTRRRSPNSLYSQAFATFGEDDVYNQQHAEGFIRLFSLPSRIRALLGLNKLFGIDNATTGNKSGSSR